MEGYQNFFDTMSQIQRTGQPIGQPATGGLGFNFGYNPVPVGDFDLSGIGNASLMDVGTQLGWGEAAKFGMNRAGSALTGLGSSIAGSKPVQGFMNMPGTDQLNALAGGLTAINGVWNGYNQNKMAKKQFAFQKDAWKQQWGASKSQYNSQIADRQAARVSSNPNAYQSVDSYMGKYGLK